MYDPICRNSATQTIEQQLQFVGTEYGKLFAIREIIRKVSLCRPERIQFKRLAVNFLVCLFVYGV
jgi:hypothetical protein